MTLTIRKLHPSFAGEATGVRLRDLQDEQTLAQIRQAVDQYAVLVFPDQDLDDDSHLAFAKRLDGVIHAKPGARVVAKNRFGNEALTDISNLGAEGEILETSDRRRLYGLANRLWHTDASFENPPGRYSMLYAYVVPPVRADTQFADMRSAYDALDDSMKARLEGLRAHHSIAYSRQTLGFEFSAEEANVLKGVWQPLVREFPDQNRRSLYLASHASKIDGLPVPEARLLLKDLMEHATQAQFVYTHEWQERDLVIWDNRATMHRGKAFDDQKHRRELRRITTLDIPSPVRTSA
ncbi:MAG: TauD/TfdA dioxygenase family protein [Burkholderiaceae bacterium]